MESIRNQLSLKNCGFRGSREGLAYFLGPEGFLSRGKLADLVVLSKSPLAVDPWEIRNIKVEKTIVGGEVAFRE